VKPIFESEAPPPPPPPDEEDELFFEESIAEFNGVQVVVNGSLKIKKQ